MAHSKQIAARTSRPKSLYVISFAPSWNPSNKQLKSCRARSARKATQTRNLYMPGIEILTPLNSLLACPTSTRTEKIDKLAAPTTCHSASAEEELTVETQQCL